MFAQSAEIATGVADLAKGREDSFVFALVMLCMVAGMIWLFSKYLSGQAERYALREKDEGARQDKQESFWREISLKNSDQLDSFAQSLERTSRAAELMAASAERTDSALSSLHETQVRDRRALACALDAIEARSREDIETAASSIREARRELINGEN